MNQYEITVDKVNFIKRMAEKYDLVYEEHKQENGVKDFNLYLDKENKYKILTYDTFFFRFIFHSTVFSRRFYGFGKSKNKIWGFS